MFTLMDNALVAAIMSILFIVQTYSGFTIPPYEEAACRQAKRRGQRMSGWGKR